MKNLVLVLTILFVTSMSLYAQEKQTSAKFNLETMELEVSTPDFEESFTIDELKSLKDVKSGNAVIQSATTIQQINQNFQQMQQQIQALQQARMQQQNKLIEIYNMIHKAIFGDDEESNEQTTNQPNQ